MIIPLFKDYGSDPVVGVIAIFGLIFVYIIWFAIAPKSAAESLKGGSPYLDKAKTERNRRKKHNTRRNQIDRMRQVSMPNDDGQYIYIFESNGLYKIGISKNPEYRRTQIQKQLNNQPIRIHFIGKVIYGRTIDVETIIHRDLINWNVPVYYNDDTVSREWFDCSLDLIETKVSKFADLTPY